MKKRDLERILASLGFRPVGGSKHDKWTNGSHTEMIPRHSEVAEPLAQAIIRRAKASTP